MSGPAHCIASATVRPCDVRCLRKSGSDSLAVDAIDDDDDDDLGAMFPQSLEERTHQMMSQMTIEVTAHGPVPVNGKGLNPIYDCTIIA
jgi:hypothetical protein